MLLVKKFKVTEMEMIVNLKEHSYPIYIEKNILKYILNSFIYNLNYRRELEYFKMFFYF